MLILKRFLVISAFCLLSYSGVCADNEDSSHFPLHDEPTKPMSNEEAYEALDKDQYEKLRSIIINPEMVDKLLIMAADKGAPATSKKALMHKRFNEDKEKEKQIAINALKAELEECRAKSQRNALIGGAILGGAASAIFVGVYKFGAWLVEKFTATT